MFSKTMEFCNKGMVQVDPLPPSYGQRPYFYIFFLLDPSLRRGEGGLTEGPSGFCLFCQNTGSFFFNKAFLWSKRPNYANSHINSGLVGVIFLSATIGPEEKKNKIKRSNFS